jgi:prepilin-type N-terminal cleavage/methylation domain-containing protein/prepilin-type processing-associated H-X9-DG protein
VNINFNTMRMHSIRKERTPERQEKECKKMPAKDFSESIPSKKKAPRSYPRKGFTLIEVLIVVTIISSLAAIATVGARKAISSAKAVIEVNAARQLVAIYVGNAADHNGRLMAGLDPDSTAVDGQGNAWPGFVSKRYPARLSESLSHNFSGTVCVNKAEDWADNFYKATVHPSFGINATFVGGNFREAEPDPERDAEQYGKFCIERLSDADSMAEQVVFISARSYSGYGDPIAGNFYVRSPYLKGRRWASSFDEKQASIKWGNVDHRHNGKAVGAFLDGSARLLNETQVQDMRIWAKGAREANDPQWSITDG